MRHRKGMAGLALSHRRFDGSWQRELKNQRELLRKLAVQPCVASFFPRPMAKLSHWAALDFGDLAPIWITQLPNGMDSAAKI